MRSCLRIADGVRGVGKHPLAKAIQCDWMKLAKELPICFWNIARHN